MKTYLLLITTLQSSNTTAYLIGGFISLGLLAYLIYTLIKPEKF